jgi:hypothetical protein
MDKTSSYTFNVGGVLNLTMIGGVALAAPKTIEWLF